jgi:hypothetical protein
MTSGTNHSSSKTVAITLVGATVLAVAIWRGSTLFRMFALLGGLILAAALTTPVIVTDEAVWTAFQIPGAGQRYFLLPMLVFAGAFFTLAGDRRNWVRRTGLVGCLMLAVGAVGDWPYPRFAHTNFDALAREFQTAPPGTRMTFLIQPPRSTPMVLTKN